MSHATGGSATGDDKSNGREILAGSLFGASFFNTADFEFGFFFDLTTFGLALGLIFVLALARELELSITLALTLELAELSLVYLWT